MEAKFKTGDRVRIIKYGSLAIVPNESNKSTLTDLDPGLVNKEGIIDKCSFDPTYCRYQYTINGIPEKYGWYEEDQLELIPNIEKGFTTREMHILDLIVDIHHQYMLLESTHPSDKSEWQTAIHHLQHILGMRILRREHPEIFPPVQ